MKEFKNIIEALNYRTICPLCKDKLICKNCYKLNNYKDFTFSDNYVIYDDLPKNNSYSVFKICESNMEFLIDTSNIIINFESKEDSHLPLYKGYPNAYSALYNYCNCRKYGYAIDISINLTNNFAKICYGSEKVEYNSNNYSFYILKYPNYIDVYIDDRLPIKLPIICDNLDDIEKFICKIKTLIAFS